MSDIHEESDNVGGVLLSVSELKPGFVLLEDIPELSGMNVGYVLSKRDIEKIQSLHRKYKLKVMDPSLRPNRVEEESENVTPVRYRREDLEKYDLDPGQKKQSIFDAKLAKQLARVVTIKKDIIRGEDYDQRFQNYLKNGREKYKDFLKTSHGAEKNKTLGVIHDYAVSSADLDGLEKTRSGPAREIVEHLRKYERGSKIFIDSVLAQKQVFSSFVEEIVVDFLSDTGYQLAKALFASVSQIEGYYDFLSAHSMQVMIVSLITAIELTKMIREKSEALAATDLNTFMAVSQKFFSLEELIELGVAALLHDIEYKNKYPNLSVNHKRGIEWDSITDLHPSNGYHICKQLDIDFEIQRAVYQHHERFDGSGYPNGLYPRFFTKYTPILMFAEAFIEQTTPNPFEPDMKPARTALVDILSKQRTCFDGDVVYAFIRAASLFPVGSWLLLSDGHIGIVMDVNKNRLERPIMKMFFDKSLGRVTSFIRDLSKIDLKIIKPIDIYTIKKMAGTSLNFIFEDN